MAVEGPSLRLFQGLQFKLALLFVLVAVVLMVAAYLAGRELVQDNLVEDTRRYQRESGLRLAENVQDRLDRARILAVNVVTLVGSSDPAGWPARIPQLAEASGLGPLIAGIGVWPEPRRLDRNVERASRFWVADSAGLLQLREDYNDARAIPYWGESWYTPARYAASGSCFWTTRFRETLAGREVVACTVPLRDGRGFNGTVTVLIATEQLQALLHDIGDRQTGYALLADRDNGLLSLTGDAARQIDAGKTPRNLAALAQQYPSFNTLALDLHRRDEAFLSRAVQSPLYDAAQISALKDATREGSRQEAESALALIWNSTGGAPNRATEPAPELRIADDAFLGESASATVLELGQPHWKLVRVTRAREGVAGAQYFFTQTLVVVGGAILLTLLLVFGGLRALVLRPLARITQQLSDARTLEESLHLQLNASARNEIGLIGHWYNERVRQLREAMDRTLSQQSQLSVEAGERARSDEQSLRLRERCSALLGSISEACIIIDARGLIEEMNGPAESLTGTVLRNLRGRPCAEAFRARPAAHGGPAPDFAALALGAGERIEQLEGLFLHVEGRAEREIQLIASSLRGPSGRVLGAVLVFRPREAQAGPAKLVIDRRSVDSVTGLPTRAACDRRLRALIDSTKLQPRTHAVIVADIDRLRHVNETAGLRAGDEVLVRMAESLVGGAPSADVFRLGADSFAVVMEATDIDSARRCANQMREALAAARFGWEDRVLNITASFGICLFDSTAAHPMELLRRADDACAAAKQGGRNALRVYEPSLDRSASAIDEATWVRRIRAGLDENLFHLTTQWVQPADNRIADGNVFDVSLALEDEEGFWAEPAAFLPVAERSGLVSEVERWALRQALEYLARNHDVVARMAFCCLPVSAPTVSDGATLELLAHLFQQNEQLPANRVCFVLRESVLADAPGPAQTFCDAMRSLGCRVAIDHFIGRGVGAVDIIRKLPAEFLRIDARHFVDLAGDAVDQVIAESLMRLARTLQRRVLVTEIGDDAARESWKRLGADYLQGIAVARPSPVVFSANG